MADFGITTKPLSKCQRMITCAGIRRCFLASRSVPETVLARVDWLTPNEGEAASLLGRSDPIDDPAAAAMALRGRLGVRNVALKLGARGVFLSLT